MGSSDRPPRAQKHSEEEWRRHRPTIIELYKTRSTRLEDVQKLMEEKYNFKAGSVSVAVLTTIEIYFEYLY